MRRFLKVFAAVVVLSLCMQQASYATLTTTTTAQIILTVATGQLGVAVTSGSLDFGSITLGGYYTSGTAVLPAHGAPTIMVSDDTGDIGWHVAMMASDITSSTATISASIITYTNPGGTLSLDTIATSLTDTDAPTTAELKTGILSTGSNGVSLATPGYVVMSAPVTLGAQHLTWNPDLSDFTIIIPKAVTVGVYTGKITLTIYVGPNSDTKGVSVDTHS
jgi:hypothetical protein